MQPILFDFNGTMFLDTEENIQAWTAYIREHTGYTVTDEDFKKYINGVPDVDIIRHFFQQDFTNAEAQVYADGKEALYRQLCLQKKSLRLTPGLPEFLDYLQAEGIPHNIATGADKGNLDFYLEHLQLDKWFAPEKIIFSDGSFPGKPHPDIYVLAAERIQVPVETCLVFEDAWLGVKAARAAGVAKIIGLAAIPESKFLYTLPEVDQVIKDFTCWRELVR
jgi:HAD superfamily hydrolase (TIGR01509 family)